MPSNGFATSVRSGAAVPAAFGPRAGCGPRVCSQNRLRRLPHSICRYRYPRRSRSHRRSNRLSARHLNGIGPVAVRPISDTPPIRCRVSDAVRDDMRPADRRRIGVRAPVVVAGADQYGRCRDRRRSWRGTVSRRTVIRAGGISPGAVSGVIGELNDLEVVAIRVVRECREAAQRSVGGLGDPMCTRVPQFMDQHRAPMCVPRLLDAAAAVSDSDLSLTRRPASGTPGGSWHASSATPPFAPSPTRSGTNTIYGNRIALDQADRRQPCGVRCVPARVCTAVWWRCG